MHKRMTITLDEVVYDWLVRSVGRGNISQFIEQQILPHTEQGSLANAYREMAADTEREQEAKQWCEALIGDVAHEAG